MKTTHLALAAGLLRATRATNDDGSHFINWDMIEHPIVETFHWHRPFPDDGTPPMGFITHCNVHHQFWAKQFKFKEFYGETLAPYGDLLTDFYTRRPYPGHWDGVNEGGDNRDLLMMEWKDVPSAVRDWIETQMLTGKMEDNNRWTYLITPKAKGGEKVTTTIGLSPAPTASPGDGNVNAHRELVPKLKNKEKVLFFIAGAIYENLPLWVAKQAKCEKQLLDLGRYHPQAKDDSNIAWVTFHSKPDKNHDIRWKVRAETLEETDMGKHHRTTWEKLHLNARRADRKARREERMAEGGRMKDEL